MSKISAETKNALHSVMQLIKLLLFILILAAAQTACSSTKNPNKQVPEHLLKFPAGSFSYPIGNSDFVSEARD